MGCGPSDANEGKKKAKKPALVVPIPEEDLLRDGIHVLPISDGDGKTFPVKGEVAVVKYAGYTTTGFNFGLAEAFSFKVDNNKVVPGWDVAIVKMSLGQKVQLSLAPAMGYGDQEGVPGIPPGSILLFEMELLEIKPQAASPKKGEALQSPSSKEVLLGLSLKKKKSLFIMVS